MLKFVSPPKTRIREEICSRLAVSVLGLLEKGRGFLQDPFSVP
jgi:hypothetical protein